MKTEHPTSVRRPIGRVSVRVEVAAYAEATKERLRDSGRIEELADTIMLACREPVYDEDMPEELRGVAALCGALGVKKSEAADVCKAECVIDREVETMKVEVDVQLLRDAGHYLSLVPNANDLVRETRRQVEEAVIDAEQRAERERDAGNKKALYEIRRVIKGGIFMEGSEEAGRLRALRQIHDIAVGVVGQGEPVDNRGTCGCQNESPIDMIRGGEGTC